MLADAEAVRRIYAIKSREAAKPMAILAGNIAQVTPLVLDFAPAEAVARQYWPGALHDRPAQVAAGSRLRHFRTSTGGNPHPGRSGRHRHPRAVRADGRDLAQSFARTAILSSGGRRPLRRDRRLSGQGSRPARRCLHGLRPDRQENAPSRRGGHRRLSRDSPLFFRNRSAIMVVNIKRPRRRSSKRGVT
ncbi:MAG: Sua5/YciO/YrdC/YwlC family protein [Bacillus subtilis]|nr:Sua5/YciO/YrdC/YwlC family protein [Bacillus subtilis]